jgi:Ca2+-binding EF-hand superfamily protein
VKEGIEASIFRNHGFSTTGNTPMNRMIGRLTALVLASAAFGGGPAIAQGLGGNGQGKWRAMFERLDTDGDGGVSRDEARAVGAMRFAAVDTDDDGRVTREEMVAAALRRATVKAETAFDRLDADGDGSVVLSELDQVAASRIDTMFKRADSDGDGVISPTEVAALRGRAGYTAD